MALLVMDMQVGIVTRYAQTGDFLTPISTAITAARAASIPVIYVAVAFRPGYPEMSPRNKSFSAIKQQQSSLSATLTTTEIHPAIAPQPTDIVVTKRRVSAFSGSDLEVVLSHSSCPSGLSCPSPCMSRWASYAKMASA